ncbi:hypothetical protein D0Z07_5071 [Hyphodiscus hymeniophilus]|uniref:DUF1760-domain-containing protein n=1 Tax=Hyphodiscus hymeniophilus TaxID=353542 RepID=A0A9P7AX65_9HELO|nr:hypothetical protein D0Z07_5071 [Hyphodiscus hymeniophilus]
MATDSIKAITESLPPASDYLTYLTILESHLSADVLPTLNNILQDAELTQNIGWDLIHLLLPMTGGEQSLKTIARLGNPREVVLKVTEALQNLDLDSVEEDTKDDATKDQPTDIDKFGILINLLSVLHPRIKTKYPSRFLSTSLMAILSAFRPTNQATLAVISFVHTISGKKRPPLPGRKSSLKIATASPNDANPDTSAPDPEAQEEDPREAAIQQKLLQSFVTHILEDYVNHNPLEWATRLQESFDPKKVVSGKSLGEAFKDDPVRATRDIIAGQLVALTIDLGLTNYKSLFEAIYKTESHPSEYDPEENYPSSPGDIPLSQAGSLFLMTSFVFASILFESKYPQPNITLFPDHAKLVSHFIGTGGPQLIGSEEAGVVDAILAIGLWLEHTNKFVNGPLEDEDYLQHLQSLSLLSANTPSPSLRYAAHVLTSSILHAHPVDRVRLTFITDTLEHCPYEALKASAVSWLKDEIITAYERKSENIFASTAALAAAQPYLFPSNAAISEASDEELVQELTQSFPFHMAVVNFLYFIGAKQYSHVTPPGMMAVVEEIYLGPLRSAEEKAVTVLGSGELDTALGDFNDVKVELQLLGERIAMASKQIDEA